MKQTKVRNTSQRVFIALPLMDEWENLPMILNCLFRQQTDAEIQVVICVNQPDMWWDMPEKKRICLDNAKTIEVLFNLQSENEISFLNGLKNKNIHIQIIDKSSPGKGWNWKKHGVGWARKVAMDAAIQIATDEDIIVSLDGDTTYGEGYLQSLLDNFSLHPEAVAISVPYYHLLIGNEKADRAILHYEIYMRYYLLNLKRINCPYAFTALGSAMAVKVKAYKAIGGMTPKLSGEDFYFLQKLCKFGRLIARNEEKVYPAARFSDRVYFGTGPAMIKGADGDWESYPIYDFRLFDEVKKTYDSFPEIFTKDINTPMTPFLMKIFANPDIWSPLRNNFKTKQQFVRACYEKVDGLRILQYLKYNQQKISSSDEGNLKAFLNRFYPDNVCELLQKEFSFNTLPVQKLNAIRNFLCKLEDNI